MVRLEARVAGVTVRHHTSTGWLELQLARMEIDGVAKIFDQSVKFWSLYETILTAMLFKQDETHGFTLAVAELHGEKFWRRRAAAANKTQESLSILATTV